MRTDASGTAGDVILLLHPNILLHCDVFVRHVGDGGRGLPFLMVYGSWKMFRSKVHLLRDGSNLRCRLPCSG